MGKALQQFAGNRPLLLYIYFNMLPLKDIPDLNAETLIPHKKMRLSTFARLAWTLMAVIVLGVVLLIAKKFDIGRLRGPDHYVDKAREAVAKKDWPAAVSAIQKVDGKMREDPKFMRLLADYLIETRTEPGMLAQVLEKLDTAGLFQAEDHLWLAQAYLADGRSTLARSTLDRVLSEQRETLLYHELRVAILKSEGRAKDAVDAENLLFRRFAHDPGVAVRKAARELVGTFPEIQEAAAKRLWQVAESGEAHSLTAIRVLTAHRGLTPIQATHLQQLADKHAQITIDDRFNISSVLLRLKPDQRQSILQIEIDRNKNSGTTSQSFQKLIAWLAREKEFGRVLKLVPRESLIKSAELFPAVAQDLAQREQWRDLMDLIQKGKELPVSNARAAGWRALASRNLQPTDHRATRAHLEEAITEGLAKSERQALITAIVIAEELNMADLVLEAMQKLAILDPSREKEHLEKSWQLAMRLKQGDVLAKIAGRLIELNPGNDTLVGRQDYLRLLRGEAIEVAASKDRPSTDTGDKEWLLRALKAYRLGDHPLAAASTAKIKSMTNLTSGESAVYAGLLAKTCGETASAFQIAEKIRPELLLAEEIVFLEMAF